MIGGGGVGEDGLNTLLSFLSPLAPPVRAATTARRAAPHGSSGRAAQIARLLSVARSAVEGATSAICW